MDHRSGSIRNRPRVLASRKIQAVSIMKMLRNSQPDFVPIRWASRRYRFLLRTVGFRVTETIVDLRSVASTRQRGFLNAALKPKKWAMKTSNDRNQERILYSKGR